MLLCHYHYDPLDRLVASGARTRAENQLFYLDKRLASESRNGRLHSFLNAGDQPLAQCTYTGKATEAALLATDAPGSVLQALAAGQRQAQAYAVYGYHPPGGGLDSLLGFNGERRDPVTGHYLLGQGYRAYNPVLMRFNSPDNLSPFDEGGLNAYGYCQGDPLNSLDSSGRAPVSVTTRSDILRSMRHVSRGRIDATRYFKRPGSTFKPPAPSPSVPSKVIELGEGRRMSFYSRKDQLNMGARKVAQNVMRNLKRLNESVEHRQGLDMRYIEHSLAAYDYALDFYKGPLSVGMTPALRDRVLLGLEVRVANLRGVTDQTTLQVYEMKMSRRFAWHLWLNEVDPRYRPDGD